MATLTYQISSPNGLRVAEADDKSTLFANLDTVNTIFLANEAAFALGTGTTECVPLPPQASMISDGSIEWYAAIPTGQTAQLAALPGGTQYDNPVGVQIALNQLGLAKDSTVQTGNNIATTGNNIAGASTPGNNSLHSQVGNPFFTDAATGNASTSGWTNRFNNGSFLPAGINAGAALPVGSGQANGFQFNCTGGGSDAQFQYGGGQNMSCMPGDIINVHWLVNAQQTADAAFLGIAFFNAAGVFIITLSANTNIINPNQWQKITGQFIAPTGAFICGPVFGIRLPANGHSFYGTAAIAYNAGTPGHLSGDHAQAIANTGINGNLPSLLDTETLNATAGTWGPFTTPLPACGSYLIAITTTTPVDPSCSDFTVTHLDSAGNIVHQDFFGAVAGGQWPVSGILAAALQLSSPTLLRGNIYGTSLQISGNKAAAAFVNGVTNTTGAVMSGFTYRLYTLPYNVPDTMPKMSNGGASLAANGLSPSNLLYSLAAQAIPAAGNARGVAIPYAGPGKLYYRQTAAGTVQLFGYTVAAGVSQPVWTAVIDVAAAAAANPEAINISIPACLIVVLNTNTAGGMNTWLSLVGDTST